MSEAKTMARIVAALFITASIASVLNVTVMAPIISSQNVLEAVSEHPGTLLQGALYELISASAVISIAIFLFPLFRRYNEALALGYVSARGIEATIVILGAIFLLMLMNLGEEYAQAAAPAASHFQTFAAILLGGVDWTFYLGPKVFFSLSAVMLNVIFYRTELVPRFLSIWGFIGALMLLAVGVMDLFGVSTPTSAVLLMLPIGLNEMVLAAWLIIKGFNPSALHSLSAVPPVK